MIQAGESAGSCLAVGSGRGKARRPPSARRPGRGSAEDGPPPCRRHVVTEPGDGRQARLPPKTLNQWKALSDGEVADAAVRRLPPRLGTASAPNPSRSQVEIAIAIAIATSEPLVATANKSSAPFSSAPPRGPYPRRAGTSPLVNPLDGGLV